MKVNSGNTRDKQVMGESKGTKEESRPGDPCAIVIFGAGGDLTKRKLIPALYNLANSKLLSQNFAIVGFARGDSDSESFRQKMSQEIHKFATGPVEPEIWNWFARRLYFIPGDFQDASAYKRLQTQLGQVDQEHQTRGNYLYYLATAPSFFAEVVKRLGAARMSQEEDGHWRRLIVEKPFGRDLDSALALNNEIKQVLEEKQIYRIDHYLGKETVQNILAFRFANGIFEPIWNRRYVDHVQITVAESVGVEQRGGYYEEAGALRDMVPNHIFQLVTLTAMEPPISFEADAVRDEQAKILRAIQPLRPEDVLHKTVRGQYGEGTVEGKQAAVYRSEPSVSPTSTTETFVALKLLIDNWRWADVPFYMRTGKRMPKRITEIAIQFKRAPFVLFRQTPVERLAPNLLVLNIQPDEGISLRFEAKQPGPIVRLGAVNMTFCYTDYFGSVPTTGYERLLYDAMIGDATLFQRADMVETAWSVVTPILDVWKALPPRSFPNYGAGTWGPQEANDLMERDGRHWRNIEP